LFGKDKRTISEHLGNVFQEGELEKSSTVRKFRIVQLEGSREVEREIDHYNLDVIISVGYRVKSPPRHTIPNLGYPALKGIHCQGFCPERRSIQNGEFHELFH
jgi:hypothetical protein